MPQESIKVPSNLLTRCSDLNELKEKATMGDLYMQYLDLQLQYNECATRHDALVKAVK